MSERSRAFAYRLEALIRLRGAERDAAKASRAQAALEVEKRSRECDDIRQAIQQAEWGLRALLRSGESIAVDEQMRLQAYLQEERGRHKAKRHELDEAMQSMSRLSAELAARQRAAKALELHKERKRRQFDESELRSSLNATDDLWLAQRKRREP
jgi:flagellar biosynthesis chaperone FliJ